MRFRRFFATSVLAMGIGMSLGAVSASAAPASDTFSSAGAIDIAATRGTTASDLAAGTRETGEPIVPGSNTAHTKWWRYIPASNGYVRFSTCSPTGMNPVPGISLGLYTGSQVNLLTTVSQATNNCPAGYDNAVLGPVLVTAGTYYYLQMGGANTIPVGEEDFNLTLDFNTAVPANDNWASATVISGGLPQSFTANNGLATVEPNEPRSDDYNERQTLWYRWTATANGTISVNNCSSAPESAMDSRIAVFTGSSPVVATDMSFIDDNDNGCPGAASNMSRVYVPVTSGTSYWIKLSNNGAVNYGFPYSLQIKWVTAPENGALPSIYPFPRIKVGTTVNVDSDGLWGGFPTPTLTRQWQLCNKAGAMCTNIAGATGMSYTPVVGDIGKALVLQVTATNSNGSVSASSPVSELIDDTPDNDLWVNRRVLPNFVDWYPDDNLWATHGEPSEPSISGFPGRNSVWYRWTAPSTGDFVIDNCLGGGSPDYLDLLLAVRTGTTSLATTTEVASADNGCGPAHPYRSALLLSATAGTSYTIEIASKYAGLTGYFLLSIAPVGDPKVTAQPSITGTAAPGGTLNLDVGDWVSPTNIIPEIHWFSCNAAGTGCVDTGLAGTSFAVQGSHAGGTLRANITLTNSYGTVTTSALSEVIAQDTDGDGVLDGLDSCPTVAGTRPNGCLPSDIVGTGVPTITGNLVTGQTLGTTNGTWTVNNDPLGYTLSYQWQRCNDATPGSCSDISGATDNTYLLAPGDLAKTIRVAVTATNADDTAQQFSFNTGFVTAPPAPPANSTPPAVSGTTIVGQTLSTTNGSWTPAGVSFTYEWLRCDDTTIGSCSAISSETANTYTLAAADLGKYIRSRVTGANVSGSLPIASSATSIILGDTDGDGVPDVNDDCPTEAGPRANGCQPSDIVGAGVPTIAGPHTVGQTLSSNEGSWTVLHDPLGYTASFQWQRCEDATPASCTDIDGATSDTYVLVGADYGKRVRVNVTATNADDTAMQSSAISSVIAQVPGNIVLPALSGTARVGATLSTTQGTWVPLGVPLTNSWLRCDTTSVVSCSVIASQTGTSYTLVAADDGKYIRSRVTGTNGAGTTEAESDSSSIVITDGDIDGVPDGSDACPGEAGTKPNGCLPSDIVGAGVPTLSGTLNVGQTITSTTGSWNVLHDPLGYSLGYQWQRCDDATVGSCADIASATASTYALVTADYGKRVRVNVTATNADDSALQSSTISAVISQIPVNNTLPSFTGTTTQGFELTANQGSWTPGDAVLTNAWLRCDDTTLGSCAVIGGQTGSTYTLVAADAAKYVRLRVTATTAAGPTVATSAASALVAADSDGDGVANSSDTCPSDVGARPNGCPPSDIVANGVPTISGTLNVGQTVSSTTGSWTALYDPIGYSLSYQWQRCDDATVGSCTNIGGATGSTYALVTADYGKRVRVNVTASNADDTALQSSAISNPVSQVPANTVAPAISGSATVGQILTANQGTWTPGDATLTNAWLRCDDTTIGSCSVIAGQSGTNYTLVAADDGKYIRVRVTGTTTASSVDANSAATAQVITVPDGDGDGVPDASDTCPAEAGPRANGCLPSDIVGAGVPTISGTQWVGAPFNASTGSWTVLHDPLVYTLSYQWQRCEDATPASCANLPLATSTTYVLTAADYGKRIRVNVTATNADDSATQSSAITGAITQVPVNDTPPSLSGTTTVGQTLTGDPGGWTPADTTVVYQWLRCNSTTIGDCVNIGSTTTVNTYTLVAADSGKYIRLGVAGTTAGGTTNAVSNPTALVVTDTDSDGNPDSTDVCPTEASARPNGCPLSDIVGNGIPTVSGTLNVGQTVSSTTGSWTVLHDPLGYTLSYEWQRCDTLSTASCTNIASATSSTYALVVADYGKRIRVNVTATNAHDTELQSSAISNAISQVPANTVAPSITGNAIVNQVLTAAQGTWTPGDATLTNTWLRCDDTTIGSCSVIGGQAGTTYALVAADDGKYIRVRVTGTTSASSVDATSASTAQVITVLDADGDGTPDASDTCPSEASARPNGCPLSDIVGDGIPTISGTLQVSNTVSSTTGSWTVLHDPLGYTLSYQWQRCDTLSTASCTDIASATSSTYALVAADYGKRVRVNVTATNAHDTEPQSSAISNVVSQLPSNTAAPSISGTARVGEFLTAANGTWTPVDATFTRAWLRCTDNASIGTCTPIPGQTGNLYGLAAADDSSFIRLQITATSAAGSASVISAATAQVVTDSDEDGVLEASDTCPYEAGTKPNGCLPSDIIASGIPGVTGIKQVGQTLSSTNGVWTVMHDPLGYGLSYQWQRCNDSTDASCSDISGASANTYVLGASDYGKHIRVNVTATNADDTEMQSSGITAVVSQLPVNTALPTVSGTPKVGSTLTGAPGTWAPAGDTTFAYQWLRCTTVAIGSCTPIGGATGTIRGLVGADDSNFIRIQVSGTTIAGTVVATSAPTAQIITDLDNDGVVDSVDACPGVTGTKPNGCLPSDIVGAGIPNITGLLATGQTINSTPGTWTVLHDQLGYTLAYQWQRCDNATSASCSDISLATSTSYVLAAADYGKRIRFNVTATNADDTALQSSAISAPVSEVPANVSLPMASGASKVGQTAIGIQGIWTPADATLTNVWLRCTTTSIGSCTPIAGQTGANYTLVAADDNRHIRLEVTATTTAGSTVATSAPTGLIITDNDNDGVVDGSDACLGETGTKPNGCLPSDIVGAGVPTISGNLVVGQTMSSTNGTWNVLHDQLSYTLSRQWQRCDDATAGSCSDIGGETSATYALTASDLGKRVRVIVTATNADDTASQSSAISTAVIPVNSPPVNNVAPAISGTTEVGNTLTASGSSTDWTPSSATLAYSWLRCTDSASEASCSAIGGADASTYALVAADSGNYIRVRVTATASALSTEIVSAASAKITTPAVVSPPPVTPPPPPPSGPNPATITGPANLKTLRPSKTRAVTFSRVSVYCGSKSTGNCTGEAVLTGKIGGKTKKLGTLKLSNLKGGGRIIAMKLSSSVIKALKKKSIKAQLAITYTSPGFAPLTYLGKVTLQKAKK